MTKKSICDTLRRTCLILAGSFIMAVNLKSFVRAGGLIPGGFNGLTRLIQEISVLLWHWEPPFSVINFILNAVPVVISFKFIGKKFTGYSCLMIVVSGILTDMVPAWPVTEDILLIAIFGGLINALAISLCLFGLVLPGDDIVSATGMPYDTLQDIIGWGEGDAPVGSLREMGVSFHPVALRGGKIDLDAVENAITPKTKLVIAQRSRGYDWRPSLMPEEFAPLAKMLHEKHPGVRLMVDNCYGEFVCEKEPSHYGADVCVGSLIKNPGGGLAPTGGYIVGTQDAVERIAYRLTAPGIGLEVGSYAASYQPFYQGLFMAPHTVAQAIKTACLAARVFEILGMTTTPAADEPRADIIQAIQMRTPERLVAFCQGIQMASPIDSMALPEPWDMPGYNDQVVMAAGTFVAGASIELSADAPMREPYTAYMQGGLTYTHGRIALQMALNRMVEQGALTLK